MERERLFYRILQLNGCGKGVWQLLKLLPERYDDNILKEIEATNWMQKLSYKGEDYIQEKSTEPQNSIYKRLFLDSDLK